MKQCQICGKEFKQRLSRHILDTHHMTIKQYYDEYLRQPNDGICPICGKPTQFVRNLYRLCCCQSHAALYRQNQKLHFDMVRDFEIKNNCTSIVKLRQLYGQGWYKAKIIDNYLESNFNTQMFYVKNEDIPKIQEYSSLHTNNGKSHQEKCVVKFLKSNNFKVIENDRRILYPKELDVYLPDYNIAVEYNGNWFHSIESGTSKDYHLKKSLACREKNIRLIHIYEFEDFDEQMQLLKDLLLGVDNYPKKDFNKNNLIKNIPKPELIYQDSRVHIYGAGKLEGSYIDENKKY